MNESEIKEKEKFDELFKFADNLLIGEIDSSNIFNITINLMQFVEKYPQMKGIDKKNLVMSTIKKIINKYNLQETIFQILPIYIDNIIDVDNRNIKIDTKKKLFFCC